MKRSRLADHLRHPNFGFEAPRRTETNYQVARARRESAAATLAELEFRHRANELIDIAALRESLGEVEIIIRRVIEPLPGEIVAAILPLAGDEAAIQNEMQIRVAAALTRLSDNLMLLK